MTLHGSSFACGIGSKISLYPDLSFFSHMLSCSCATSTSMRSCIAPATLNSLTCSSLQFLFFNQLWQTIINSANINFLSAFTVFNCSWSCGFGGGGGTMIRGFNKSYKLRLSIQVQAVWSVTMKLRSSHGRPKMMGRHSLGVTTALTTHEVHEESNDERESLA